MAFASAAFGPGSWEARQKMLVQLAQPLAIFGISLLVLLVFRRLLLSRYRVKPDTPPTLAAEMVEALGLASIFWCLAGALAVALRFADLTERQIQIAGLWIVIFITVSLSLVMSSAAVRVISLYGSRQGMPFAVTGLSRTLTRVFVLSIGGMVLMHYLGLSITPLVTAFGVGGLALALALQDTLANFFAGVHILVENPISVGDFIRLSTGEEGTVTDIGWRTTRVLTGRNSTVVIPNTKITSSSLTNFSLPNRRVVADVPIAVSQQADPDQVMAIAQEIAAATSVVLADPAPLVLMDQGVLPTHMGFKLLVHVQNRIQQEIVQSEIRLRLMRRFREESVPLPPAEMAIGRGASS
jgi:small-conductance mechanosensitive channel